MPFVKLDCGILNSTLWLDRTARDVFITALLMAEPFETTEPISQMEIESLNDTGWNVPPGWYGFVPAAGVGILHRAGVDEGAEGRAILSALGSPEASSRSQDYEGRRLVRVNGGFIVLNFMKYRDRDYTTAERSRRYRERVASRRVAAQSRRDITQAEAEEEAEEEVQTPEELFDTFWTVYPKKKAKADAQRAFKKLAPDAALVRRIVEAVACQSRSVDWTKNGGQFVPYPATYLNDQRWLDEADTLRDPSTPWCLHEPPCRHSQQHNNRICEEAKALRARP
jgi:hypothetical protein